MHLFAAKPGGFADDEGIVDLQQTPGDIVILSAADSSLSALSQAAERLGDAYPSLRLANWMNLVKPAAYDLYEHKVLEHARVVIVSLLGGASYWQYGYERLLEWAEALSERQLIVVPGCDAPDDPLLEASTVTFQCAWSVWRYLREGGVDNAEQLLRYIAAQFLEMSYRWREPRPIPEAVLYRPDNGDSGHELTLQEWQKTRSAAQPVCLVLFYRSYLQGANTAVFDGLIRALQRKGLNPLPVAVASLKQDSCLDYINHLIERTGAMLIVNTTSFAVNRGPQDSNAEPGNEAGRLFSGRPVVLQAILASSTEEDWQEQMAGLRSRDVAMQVVLPEMDGRVITRAIGFKTEARYSQRCELAVIRHAVHQERAEFVAELARRFCSLRHKPNEQKRLALVLANYPNRDGRIGNGVGLDTPASTIRILEALQKAGYPVADLPADGNGLIDALQGAVTNAPESIDQRPCYQSIAVDDYLNWFQTLPTDLQQAIWSRWGHPRQDPKYRSGRLMLAGVRLGETFVGIQPERDFIDDPTQTYHDTELVPPHSYLAFYLWLREHYQVDAVIHVGKHGNLEWLPGKSTALSGRCWPDITLGPVPHFYPFIVNDPGEGAQAKRRSQAVIIDHLMPPMTRAELYGDMAELESLADEFYQALGMDPRREALLRKSIVAHLRRTGIDQELAQGGEAAAIDDETLLNQLDTYLCDIKESQIRHGLHVLGTLPDDDKLTGTLVALLRLPRGNTPAYRGILHNLTLDLALSGEDRDFDPLTAGAEPWEGPCPEVLRKLSETPWRSCADTRERLELFAHDIVRAYVIGERSLETLAENYPATAEQCAYARESVLAAIKQGAELEIQSLLDGLTGYLVPPGPSGAPSRGRLDVLPTGRNFFTVDNRAIPSPAAWQLGERSAQSFVERYLQDNGDFPRRLGLSIWGTATMRTGGDDIAQALALMGVRPVWSVGSQRVVDVEVIPTMLLGRPRVDVTLRVSGFFRDAFANVMRLFDAAVQAVAEYQEPGNENTIRQAVLSRQAELQAEGLDAEAAKRQASYRIFGSRPGDYGTGLNRLIDGRQWESRDELGEAYVAAGAFAYGQSEEYGVSARADFEHQLSNLDSVLQNQDNREHDILDSNAYFAFQGGMANATRSLRGDAPSIYHADHSNPASPRIRTLQEELSRVIRARVLNPKWIEAMREHDYKGGFEMAATVDYLFAYDATTDLVADYQYQQVTDALVFNAENQQFLRDNNPAALVEMAERLLETTQRGMWQEPGDHAAALQDLLLEMDEAQEQAAMQATGGDYDG
ncbi:MAG: cobaltochelatase subunit CobN [Pseudomonadales bacterium]|nr:cobaltochelatase subunit CobN [Pseudomonadales bacterium]